MNADYDRIAGAIRYLEQYAERQPSLDQLAARLNLSPFHFQRLFRRWSGVTPKQFLQFVTVEHAKRVLAQSRSVLDAAYATGLSGPGRLHDHFVTLEAVTPGEYKSAGAGLTIRHGVHPTPFGPAFLAATDRGLCRLAFIAPSGGGEAELTALRSAWPYAGLIEDRAAVGLIAKQVFSPACSEKTPVTLIVKGTNFQIQVWQALLRIPSGSLCRYEQVAAAIGKPTAARAVGQAVATNPVAYLIPCHRVIRATGVIGDYRWGTTRKRAMIGWEAAALATARDDAVRAAPAQ